MLNVVPIGGRQAFLFMSSRSLLSFPIMIGQRQPSLHDMLSFLSHGIELLVQGMGAPKRTTTRLLKDLDEIRVCKAVDKSQLGVFSAIAADYFHRVNTEGGFPKAVLGAIISGVNSTPKL